MASLGFPIENDKYYPDLQDEVPDNYEKPLQLLAMELEFADPLSDGIRRFRSRRKLHW
jgi:tRNA pseudouridine32 synthase/23S rRNA pseudouridine746 synthase